MNSFLSDWDGGRPLPPAFLELPAQVYANDPHWHGEDAQSVSAAFSASSNPWFNGNRAWLGVVPGKARLAGFFRPGQIIDGEPAAFFGYWESTADALDDNRRLFTACAEWARALGAKRLYGPINFTTFGNYRVRLDGFADGAFPGEPWNPPHYAPLLALLGFDQRYRYQSTFNNTAAVLETVKPDYLRVKPKLEAVLSMEAMTPEFWLANLDELYGFVDQVFGGNFAYTPLSPEAFAVQCGKPFAERFCPKTSVLARTRDGRIAGFFLVYPDYGPLLRQGNAERVSASTLNYTTHMERLPLPRRGLARTGGVHPEFRALGLFTAMGCELCLRAEGIYEELAATLVREDNRSLNFAARHGTAAAHNYALFQRAL